MTEGWEDCRLLGPGWKRREVFRKSGATCGKTDTYYQSPTGEKFRSKLEMMKYLGSSVDLTLFDYKNGTLMAPEDLQIRKRKQSGGSSQEPKAKMPVPVPAPLDGVSTTAADGTMVVCCEGCKAWFSGVLFPRKKCISWFCGDCKAERRAFVKEQKFYKTVGCGACAACQLPEDCAACTVCLIRAQNPEYGSMWKCVKRRCCKIVKKKSNLPSEKGMNIVPKVKPKKLSLSKKKARTPQVSTTQVSTAQVSTPQVATQQGSTTQASIPQVCIPQVCIPQACIPQVTMPQVRIPQVSIPLVNILKVCTPQVIATQVTKQQVSTPQSTSTILKVKHKKNYGCGMCQPCRVTEDCGGCWTCIKKRTEPDRKMKRQWKCAKRRCLRKRKIQQLRHQKIREKIHQLEKEKLVTKMKTNAPKELINVVPELQIHCDPVETTIFTPKEVTVSVQNEKTHFVSKEKTHSVPKSMTHFVSKEKTHSVSKNKTHFVSKEKINYFPKSKTQFVSKEKTHSGPKNKAHFVPKETTNFVPKETTYFVPEKTDFVPEEKIDFVLEEKTDFVPEEKTDFLPLEKTNFVPKEKKHFVTKDKKGFVTKKLTVKWKLPFDRERDSSSMQMAKLKKKQQIRSKLNEQKLAVKRHLSKCRNKRKCGECEACLQKVDCGRCDFCRDKPKFGGRNLKRQKCRWRQCLRYAMLTEPYLDPCNAVYPAVIAVGSARVLKEKNIPAVLKRVKQERGEGLSHERMDTMSESSSDEDYEANGFSSEQSFSSDSSIHIKQEVDTNGTCEETLLASLVHKDHPLPSNIDEVLIESNLAEADESTPVIMEIFSLGSYQAFSRLDIVLREFLKELNEIPLPAHWEVLPLDSPNLQLVQRSKQSTMADTVIYIQPGLYFQITVQDLYLPSNHEVYANHPCRLTTVDDVVELICNLEAYRLCAGLPESTQRSPGCEILVYGDRCPQCNLSPWPSGADL